MGTQERRAREKKLRAQQIQAAAEKVFLEQGFFNATIERIAREAELSTGTIYLYFKTKEELYASLNLKTILKVDRELDRIMKDENLGIEEKLSEAWQMLISVFCRSQLSLRALVHGQLQGSLQNISQELLEELHDTGRNILNKIAAIFTTGMDEDIFVRENPMALADIVWSTFTGVISWEEAKRTTDPNKNHLQSTLDVAFANFMRGIKK